MNRKRVLSLFLALCLTTGIVGSAPLSASAAETPSQIVSEVEANDEHADVHTDAKIEESAQAEAVEAPAPVEVPVEEPASEQEKKPEEHEHVDMAPMDVSSEEERAEELDARKSEWEEMVKELWEQAETEIQDAAKQAENAPEPKPGKGARAATLASYSGIGNNANYNLGGSGEVGYQGVWNSTTNEPTMYTSTMYHSSGNRTVHLKNIGLDARTRNAPAINVTGGTLTLVLEGTSKLYGASGYAGIQVAPSASLIISNESSGTMYVYGGNGTATQAAAGAGIGSGPNTNVNFYTGTAAASTGNGTIQIKGGTTYAYGGGLAYYGGAGIGGGSGCYGRNITISGGKVYAYGSGTAYLGAAGIGGGYKGYGQNITISGGNVTACSTDDATSYKGGAGIGGGADAYGTSITITGGTVHADSPGSRTDSGYANGAGIGGGANGYGSNITISGGSVYANSGNLPSNWNVYNTDANYGGGAGIGGGANAWGGNITIQNANTFVDARACSGAGIGGGRSGAGLNIQITNVITDTVNGWSAYAAGIGSGYGVQDGSYGQPGLINATDTISGAKTVTNITISNSYARGHSQVGVGIGQAPYCYGKTYDQYTSINITNNSHVYGENENQYKYTSSAWNQMPGVGIGAGAYTGVALKSEDQTNRRSTVKIVGTGSATIVRGDFATTNDYSTGIGIGGGSKVCDLTVTLNGIQQVETYYKSGNGGSDSTGIGMGYGSGVSNIESKQTISLVNIPTVSIVHGDDGISLGAANSLKTTDTVVTVRGCGNVSASGTSEWYGVSIGRYGLDTSSSCVIEVFDCTSLYLTGAYSLYQVGSGAGHILVKNVTDGISGTGSFGGYMTDTNYIKIQNVNGISLWSLVIDNSASTGTFVLDSCGDLSFNGYNGNRPVGIGSSAGSTKIDIKNCGAINANGLYAGIGSVNDFSGVCDIAFTNCGDITAGSNQFYGVAIGEQGLNTTGHATKIQFMNCGDVTVNKSGDYSYNGSMNADWSAYGPAIGKGGYGATSTTSKYYPQGKRCDIVFDNCGALTVNDSTYYTAAIGTGSWVRSGDVNIDIKRPAGSEKKPITITRSGIYQTGIGTGYGTSAAGLTCDINITGYGDIEILTPNTNWQYGDVGIGLGAGSSVYTTGTTNVCNVLIKDCGAIKSHIPQYPQPYVGIGAGCNSGAIPTSVKLQNCGDVLVDGGYSNSTNLGPTDYAGTVVAIGKGYNSSVPLDLDIVSCCNVMIDVYGGGIGSTYLSSGDTDIQIQNCGNLDVKSKMFGSTGIGAGYDSCDDLTIGITNCGTINVQHSGDVSNSYPGACIGSGSYKTQGNVDIDIINCGNMVVNNGTDDGTGIGTGSANSNVTVDVDITSNSNATLTMSSYGVAIGRGSTTGNNTATNYAVTSATDPRGCLVTLSGLGDIVITLQGSSRYTVGVGSGRMFANNSAAQVPTTVYIDLNGGLTVNGATSEYCTGIGLGYDSEGNIFTDVDILTKGDVEVNHAATGVGAGPYASANSGKMVQCEIDIEAVDHDVIATAMPFGTAIGTGRNTKTSKDRVSVHVGIGDTKTNNVRAWALNGVGVGAGSSSSNTSSNVGLDVQIAVNGDVIASGGTTLEKADSTYGVGIGTGYGYSGNDEVSLQILEAKNLKAYGSTNGPGIGVGSNTSGATGLDLIVGEAIENVYAEGGTNAPGIGLGARASGTANEGNITIGTPVAANGPKVVSRSKGSAGIGIGNDATAGRVTLTFHSADIDSKSEDGPAMGIGKGVSKATLDLNLRGCTGNFTGTGYSAGIGQGVDNSNSVMDLDIQGGTITARGSKGGAGIGTGPVNAACSLSLNAHGGATVEGFGSSSLDNELDVLGSTGNTILDNLASQRLMGSGAGIGGSNGDQIVSIIIGDATVKANGHGIDNYGSAGIGGGSNGDGGTILFRGSTIIANGSERGAGVGGGSRGNGGDVTINGGNVTVMGGKYDSAGIGGGASAADHGTLEFGGTPKILVYGCPNYQLAVPGEVTTNGIKFMQNTLMSVPESATQFHVKDAGEKDVIDIMQPTGYGAFSTTVSPTLPDETIYNVFMDSTKNGSPIVYQMSTPYAVEDFAVKTAEAYAAELLTIIDFYTVKFDTDGGSTVPDQSVRINNTLTLPETAPTKGSYKFGGWYTDPEFKNLYDFSQVVTSDMTLYARWISPDKAVYCVQHWKQTLDNTYVLSSEQYLEGIVGETVTAEAIETEGFSPINTDGTKLSGVVPTTGTLKLALYYNRNMVTIQFKNIDRLVGQPEGVTSISAMYGSTIVLPKAEKDGWVFDYYTKDTEDGEQVQLLPARVETFGDTMYANWTLKSGVKYIVCHYQQQLDGTYKEVSKEYFAASKAGAQITAEQPEYDGFHVNTYITDGTGTGIAAEDGSTVLRVYYDLNDVTVKLKEGYGLSESSIKRRAGEAANVPTPYRTGYRFDGWFKADGTKLADDARIDECGEELTAHWTAASTTPYSVRYYLQAPSLNYKIDRVDDLQGETDKNVAAQELVYDGYTLNDSKSKSNGTVKGDGSLILSVYYDAVTHTVTYNSNGGTLIAAQSGIVHGGTARRPANPTKTGYDFEGWYIDSGCIIPFSFTEGVTSDVTVYAKWSPKGDTQYKTQYWFENEAGSYEMKDEVTLSGTSGSYVQANIRYFNDYEENLTHKDRKVSGRIEADGSLVLKVYYDYRKVSVTFDSNGGTEIPDQTVKINGRVTEPAAPTREGYNFVGWYTNQSLSRAFDFANMIVKKDMTLYAKWSASGDTSYTIEHWTEGVDGAYVKNETITLNGKAGDVVEASLKSIEGYHENKIHNDRKAVGIVTADGKLVLKLFYERNEYEVNFVTNCETNVQSQIVKFEQKVTKPADLKREDYVFNGWYSDPAYTNAFDFDTKVSQNITLYAKWTKLGDVDYSVEYYKENESGEYEIADTVTLSGANGEKVKAEFRNYVGFVENEVHADRKIEGTLERGKSLTLKRFYKRVELTVKFETNCEQDIPDQTVKYGAIIDEKVLERHGYEFGGWFTNQSLTKPYDFKNRIEKDLTLYAKWTSKGDIAYTTEYYTQKLDGSYELVASVVNNAADQSVVNAVIRNYDGFVEDTENKDRLVTGTLSYDSDLVLKVYYNRKSMTVSYETNCEADIPDVQVKYGATADEKTVTREGYTFGGWYTNMSLTKLYDFDREVTNDLILYAKWTATGDTEYEVQHWFENDSGEYELQKSFKYDAKAGETVQAIALDSNGFIENQTHLDRKTVGTVTADGKLVLKLFYDRAQYEIDFNTGCDSHVESQSVKFGSKVTEPEVITRDGYEFAGWYSDAKCEDFYDFESEVSSDMTLYAKWTKQGAVSYRTEYYKEKLDGEYELIDTVEASGDIGDKVKAEFRFYKGFEENLEHEDRFDSGVLAQGEELVLKKFYDRQVFEVRYESNGGSDLENKTVKFQGVAEEVKPEKSGYEFAGWFTNQGLTKAYDFETLIEKDLVLYAKWTAVAEAPYKTEYYKFDREAKDYVLFETVDAKGKPFTVVKAEVKNYPGFKLVTRDETVEKGEITPEGTLVLRLYYDVYIPSYGGNDPYEENPQLRPSLDMLNLKEHISYISGRGNNKFAPEASITRAEVAMIVYRLMTDETKAKFQTEENEFIDVSEKHWAYKAIATIANADIVSGYGDGRFGPDKPITRAELTTILTRFYEEQEHEGRDLFSDISGHWANNMINRAAEIGFISGYTDGTFKPNQNITRAETVTMFNRILSRKAAKDTVVEGYKVFDDVFESAWYFWNVVEASNGHDHQFLNNRETWTGLFDTEQK